MCSGSVSEGERFVLLTLVELFNGYFHNHNSDKIKQNQQQCNIEKAGVRRKWRYFRKVYIYIYILFNKMSSKYQDA